MSSQPAERCRAEVRCGNVWHPYREPCKNKATEPDGYCKVHSPELRRQREEAKRSKEERDGPTRWPDREFWRRDQRIKRLEEQIRELGGVPRV